jgi:hypothetical protein
MGLQDGLRDHFGKPHCEKLIHFDGEHIEFGGLGAEYSGAKFSLGDFKAYKEKINDSSELAKALDDYQYNVCQRTRDLPKDVRPRYIEYQIAAIGVLSALRYTLEAFNKDPEGQRQKLENIVDKMQSFMTAFADEPKPRATASNHVAYAEVSTYQGPSESPFDKEVRREAAKRNAYAGALALSGLTSQETTDLAKEFANRP